MLLTAGILFFVFGASEIVRRAIIEVNGYVVEKNISCSKPFNNRCVAQYTIINNKGEHVLYYAGPNDHSLSRKIEIGKLVDKRKGKIEYFVNGNRVDDFPLFFYLLVSIFGIGIFMFAYLKNTHGKIKKSRFT